MFRVDILVRIGRGSVRIGVYLYIHIYIYICMSANRPSADRSFACVWAEGLRAQDLCCLDRQCAPVLQVPRLYRQAFLSFAEYFCGGHFSRPSGFMQAAVDAV